jgi:hypothetical protein
MLNIVFLEAFPKKSLSCCRNRHTASASRTALRHRGYELKAKRQQLEQKLKKKKKKQLLADE